MSIVDEGIDDVVKRWNSNRTPALAVSTSTGVVSLDGALGGGLPSGATEIYGPASSGKTSLLFEIIATAQRSGWVAALCPSEYLDIPYMRHLGVDLNSLVLLTGNTGEWILDGAIQFIETHEGLANGVLLAIDSATGLRPENDEFGNWNLMIDTFLAAALPALGASSAIVMTNQIRTRRSIRPDRFFVDGDTDSTARRILDRFSARLELGRSDVTDDRFSLWVNITASLLSRPGVVVQLPFLKGDGVDTMRDLLRVAVSGGVVEQLSSWFRFEGEVIGHGEDLAVEALEANRGLAKRILDRTIRGA